MDRKPPDKGNNVPDEVNVGGRRFVKATKKPKAKASSGSSVSSGADASSGADIKPATSTQPDINSPSDDTPMEATPSPSTPVTEPEATSSAAHPVNAGATSPAHMVIDPEEIPEVGTERPYPRSVFVDSILPELPHITPVEDRRVPIPRALVSLISDIASSSTSPEGHSTLGIVPQFPEMPDITEQILLSTICNFGFLKQLLPHKDR